MKTMSDAYSNKLGTAIQDYAEKIIRMQNYT